MDDDVPGLVPVGDLVIELAAPIAELAWDLPVDQQATAAPEDPFFPGFGRDSFLSPRRLNLDVPLELLARREADALVLAANLPRQPIVTSLMPVYHRLSISVDIDG